MKRISLFVVILISICISISCKKDSDTSHVKDNPKEEYNNPYLNPNLTYGSLTDIEGNKYATIDVGSQRWMAENLRTSKYNDGTPIPNVTDSAAWVNETQGAYCYYDNDPKNNSPYGKLYNGYTIDSKKICPKGWHIPSDNEVGILIDYLGRRTPYGVKLKATGNLEDGTGLWDKYDEEEVEGTNESGFTALPGGIRRFGEFELLGSVMSFWSSELIDNNYMSLILYASNNDLMSTSTTFQGARRLGLSCRCLSDESVKDDI